MNRPFDLNQLGQPVGNPGDAFDLSKMVPLESLAEGMQVAAKFAQIPTPNGPMPMPVLEMTFHVNGRRQVISITPDMTVPIAHTVLGWMMSMAPQPANQVIGQQEGQ